jgi:hypothetical protein
MQFTLKNNPNKKVRKEEFLETNPPKKAFENQCKKELNFKYQFSGIYGKTSENFMQIYFALAL